jgi:uncharacterized membrane protein
MTSKVLNRIFGDCITKVLTLANLVFVLYEVIWYAVFAIALVHSIKKHGLGKSLVFFLPAIIWGLLLEYATQEVFLRYHYGEGFLVYIANVPLNISFAWTALMYFSYWLVTQKIKLKNPLSVALAASIPLLLVDILILEPTASWFGFWVWTPPGIWFDSSIGNIYGWFWVIVLYLSFYQLVNLKIKDKRKGLILNLVLIALRIAILILLLQIWMWFFGNL